MSRACNAQDRLDLLFVAKNTKGTSAGSRCVERQPVRAEFAELVDEVGKQAIDYRLAHSSTQNHPRSLANEPLGCERPGDGLPCDLVTCATLYYCALGSQVGVDKLVGGWFP